MVFSSPLFIFLFLPVVLAGYFLLPGIRARNYWLLAVSIVFYAWGEADFVFLLLVSTLINYGLGRGLDQSQDPGRRKALLTLAVVANVGFLAVFKYAGIAVSTLNIPLAGLGLGPLPVPQIALPIGISFFTFHALSYVIDIYRGKWRSARHPGDTALYIFFFPQLVAGPILRWNAIAPQLEQRSFDAATFAEGVRRFTGGLAKKMLVANTVAAPADQIFALPAAQLSPSVAWLGAVCYMLQIYFDFSGYSDMAVGLGKMFGFQFLENFQFPYTAQSLRDFWRRWHISLSTWFRDYVYIPLGGNRVSTARNDFNLVVVFFLCGLWHGANWTFVVWGLYHGVFLILERTPWGTWLEKLPRGLRHGYTLFVVMMGWVLFRSDSFGRAADYFVALAGGQHLLAPQNVGRYTSHELIAALAAGSAFSLPLWAAIKAAGARLARTVPGRAGAFCGGLGHALEILLVAGLLLISVIWLAGGTYNPFIYFRF